MPKPKQKETTQKQRLARRRRRACCAGGRRTTAGTGHRRCFRQGRRADIYAAKCAGGPPVESGELGRPHSVSRGFMQHMQLMAAHAAFLTHAADAPRRKTKKNIIVRASRVMFFMCQIMMRHYFPQYIFEPSKTSLITTAQHSCPGTDPRVCPGPDVAQLDVHSITNFRVHQRADR